MNLSADCMICQLNGQLKKILPLGTEASRAEYMSRVLKLIGDAAPTHSSPWVTLLLEQEFENFWGIPMHGFDEQKSRYNQIMLEKESMFDGIMAKTTTPLETAIKLARAGNYIDFGAKIQVDEVTLNEILKKSLDEELPSETVQHFKNDLANAASLVYLTDNCGEIVLDKVLIKTIQSLYPKISITIITRGGNALNDATVEDAIAVGMDKLAPVVGNGTCIAGTQLSEISAEARELLTGADLIISKGMGNFETMSSCGLNVYYLFLCKCNYFERRFKLPRLTGTFLRERDHESDYWNTF